MDEVRGRLRCPGLSQLDKINYPGKPGDFQGACAVLAFPLHFLPWEKAKAITQPRSDLCSVHNKLLQFCQEML
jgi:hypothetical protein